MRPAECAGKQAYGGPLRPRSSADCGWGDMARFAPNVGCGVGFLAAVPFGIAVVLLWVKYERCVNESVDGGVFRRAAYPLNGLTSVLDERKRALTVV